MSQQPVKNTPPAIDWDLGLKLAGNKPQLAKDILAVLMETLADDLQDIVKSKNDPNIVLQKVHKMHGAISYCGLPRLKKLLAEFEQALKNEHLGHLEAYLEAMSAEVQLVLDEFAETNSHDR
jgi:HPt (histidine-containing phosphotransfer) domain-containing protein